jgi:hypothetical protein
VAKWCFGFAVLFCEWQPQGIRLVERMYMLKIRSGQKNQLPPLPTFGGQLVGIKNSVRLIGIGVILSVNRTEPTLNQTEAWDTMLFYLVDVLIFG